MGNLLVFWLAFCKIDDELWIVRCSLSIRGENHGRRIANQKSKCKMQNYIVKIKNSKVSHGTCGHGQFYNCRESSTNRPIFMQNKANFLEAEMNVCSILKKYYENESHRRLQKNKAKQSQFPIILVSLNWLCIICFQSYGKAMHNMPNRRNFYGEFTKWQMPRKQMR